MVRKLVCAAAVLLFLLPAGAEARTPRTDCQSKAVKERYSALYFRVAKLHGKRAPGRNIRRWGLSTKRHSGCRHLRRSSRVLRRMLMPAPAAAYVSAGRPYVPPAGTGTLAAGGTLSAIAQCESGGNPRAVSPGGQYRGKYQFSYSTWASVGGSGDPAAASEAEQDRRAAILYARSGPGQWPVCGR